MKTEILSESQRVLELKTAILLYGDSQSYLPTIHDVIKMPDGSLQLEAGVLMSQAALNKVQRQITGLPRDRCFFPDNLLNWETDSMVWWTKPRRRPIFFRTNSELDTLAIDRTVLHPALLFRIQGRQLSVWALNSSERPLPDSPVFQAPYHNVYQNGSMCRGDVMYPTHIHPSKIEAWEQCFFGSYFSHSPISTKITTHPGGLIGYWKEKLLEVSDYETTQNYLIPTMLGPSTVLGCIMNEDLN